MRKACLAALERAVAHSQAARYRPPCCSFVVCSGGPSPSGWEAQAAVRGRLRVQPAFLQRYSTGTSHGSPRHDMVAVFTCGQCGTRAAKEFSRQAYDTGVVIATCPGCRARHLLADRKGWFGAQGSVEDFLAERGEGVVRKRDDGTEEILLEDLLGWSKAPSA